MQNCSSCFLSSIADRFCYVNSISDALSLELGVKYVPLRVRNWTPSLKLRIFNTQLDKVLSDAGESSAELQIQIR